MDNDKNFELLQQLSKELDLQVKEGINLMNYAEANKSICYFGATQSKIDLAHATGRFEGALIAYRIFLSLFPHIPDPMLSTEGMNDVRLRS